MPRMTKEINKATNAKAEEITLSDTGSRPIVIGKTPFRCSNNLNSLLRAFNPTCSRRTFIPPAVEPVVPPTVIRKRIRICEAAPHRTKSPIPSGRALLKPVDDARATTLKTESRRTVVNDPRSSEVFMSVTSRAAVNVTPKKTLVSDERNQTYLSL